MKYLIKINTRWKVKNTYKSSMNQENLNISDVIQSLSLLKGRIQSLQLDVERIDKETMEGRLKAMYNQVERLLDKLNDNVV
jgi:hypothetical protein